jgi:predicted deacylase
MSAPLTVGSVTAAPGQLASGWIDVPDGVDTGTRVPVTVANGAAAGPALALVAGTHGSEYTSILALQRLRCQLEPARMRGAAILVHMATPPAFYGRRIYHGPDGKNLNRVYPGRGRRHGERANLYVVGTPPVSAGEPLCGLGHLAETSRVA